MKTTLRTFGAAFCLLASVAQAQINLGDIAIIQVNNITDGFTWVALKNITSTASATDSSWGASSGQGWRTTESYHTTLPASIAAGTIGFASMTTNLSNGGDQIFLYNNNTTNFTATTTAAQASFIFGINWDNSGWLTSGAFSTTQSYLPSTLAQHSLTLGSGDNWYYTGSTAGSASALLASILNPQNWATSSDGLAQFNSLRPDVARFEITPDEGAILTAVPEPSMLSRTLCAISGLVLLVRKKLYARRHSAAR